MFLIQPLAQGSWADWFKLAPDMHIKPVVKFCTTLCEIGFYQTATLEQVKQLIHEGHHPNTKSRLGYPPLVALFEQAGRWGSYYNNPDYQPNPELKQIFNLLIDKGADVNYEFEGFTFLHMAVNGNADLSIVKDLVEKYGLDVNAQSNGKRRFRPIDFSMFMVFSSVYENRVDRAYQNPCSVYDYLLAQGSKPHQFRFEEGDYPVSFIFVYPQEVEYTTYRINYSDSNLYPPFCD